MGKYGEIAIKAAKMIKKDSKLLPVDAWQSAAEEVFLDRNSLQEKSCPKSAFLGLCEEGLINGVPQGNYTRSEKNKAYAIKALELLRENPQLTEKEIWQIIFHSQRVKRYNQQIDVVIALFQQGCLI